MITLIEHDTTPASLADRFRGETTEKLSDLYRLVRVMDLGDVLDPWAQIAAVAARELRVRIAADWLHSNWCPVVTCPAPGEHLTGVADAARGIVFAFDAGRGLAEAVYRAMTPDGVTSARRTADLSRDPSFQRLIADLVAVVPGETEAAA